MPVQRARASRASHVLAIARTLSIVTPSIPGAQPLDPECRDVPAGDGSRQELPGCHALSMTRILSWNLNHRARPKPIPPGVVEAIRALRPDVLVLNEYVEGADRVRFEGELRELGLAWIKVSERRPNHNQVLMASRLEFIVGAVPPPSTRCDSHGRTNFLAASLRNPEFTLIGMRAPAYKSAADVRAYWGELAGILKSVSTGKVILVGDLNADPEVDRSIGGQHLRTLRDAGWKIPAASGEWSYMSDSGAATSRIDHVVASPGVASVSASYVTTLPGLVIAGTRAMGALSDHAICLCEVDG